MCFYLARENFQSHRSILESRGMAARGKSSVGEQTQRALISLKSHCMRPDRLLSLLESGIEQRLSHEGPLPNLRQPTVHTAVPRQPPAALEQMPEPEGQVNIVGNYGSMSWPSDGSQRTEHGLSPEAPPGDDPSVLTIHHVDLPTLEDDALYLEPLPFMDMGWNPGILHQDLDPTSGTEELDTSLELESTLMEPTLLPISRTIFSEL